MLKRRWAVTLVVLCVAAIARMSAQQTPIVIQTGVMLDGKGHVLNNAQIVVANGKIVRVEPNGKARPTYNLTGLTVMPGWIDAHDHITWHFGPNGRVEDKSETQQQAALAAAANSYATLMAGFTTIQSLGAP
jgi:imidazolonepropionase-like amidohydrolase